MDTLELGTRLDDYLIVDVLGQGGFGVTYQALDPSLQRHLAVKEYFPEQFAERRDGLIVAREGDENQQMFQWGLERFLSEARTLARFQHPNVVEVTRYFEANGSAYLAMKFEEGKNLDDWLKDRNEPLTESEITSLILPILDGLQAIHEQGLIHRDVKPQNIMIRNDGTPVLIDFGSARPASRKENTALTAVISPGYSPPEQYGIDDTTAQGPATDIYAISGVIYRMISGNGPADALLRMAGKQMEAAAKVSASKLSPQLLAAVDAGLALDATSRPQSAEEFRDLLAGKAVGNAAGKPTKATASPPRADDATFVRPVSAGPAAPETKRSFGWVWGGLAALALAVAGYVGFGWWQERATPMETPVAEVAPVVEPAPFTVVVNPADASVKFARLQKPYSAGMPLPPGDYPIVITADGYEEREETLAHGTEPTRHEVMLTPLIAVEATPPEIAEARYPLTVELWPKDASVELVGSPQRYRPGLEIAPGDYRIRISKAGYATWDQSYVMPERQATVAVTLRPKPGAEFTDPLADLSSPGKALSRPGPAMVVIPAGKFEMGDLAGIGQADENPVHPVTIDRPFALSKYEITFDDYAPFAKTTAAELPPNKSGEGNRPVTNVTWTKATEYASWLSARTGERYRLPSESEWEYAARAGATTRYPWGDKITCGKAHVKACRNAWGSDPAPVGSFTANGFGLYDMHGNVQEMVQDCYHNSYSGVPADGRARERRDGFFCDVRVTRGGSVNSNAYQLRTARRGNVDPRRNPYTDLGFRVARAIRVPGS